MNVLSRIGARLVMAIFSIQSPENSKSLCAESAICTPGGYDQPADNCDCGTCGWNPRENLPKYDIMRCFGRCMFERVSEIARALHR